MPELAPAGYAVIGARLAELARQTLAELPELDDEAMMTAFVHLRAVLTAQLTLGSLSQLYPPLPPPPPKPPAPPMVQDLSGRWHDRPPAEDAELDALVADALAEDDVKEAQHA